MLGNSSFNDSCLRCPENCMKCYFLDTLMVCSSCYPQYYIVSISEAIKYNGNFCHPCLADCLTCSNGSSCMSCLNGSLVKGSCTTI